MVLNSMEDSLATFALPSLITDEFRIGFTIHLVFSARLKRETSVGSKGVVKMLKTHFELWNNAH